MTLPEACGLALLRAAGAAGIATMLAPPVARLIVGRPSTHHVSPRRSQRLLVFACLLAVLLAPAIAIGYAYAHSMLALVRYPWLNEAAYLLILALKFTPVAVLVVLLAPPSPMSPTASHLLSLSSATQTWRWRLARLTRGPGHHLMLAACLVGLLAFQEFEIASLMGITTWSVWLFDAQVGGLAIRESLRHALWPVAIEMTLLVCPALYLLLRDPPSPGDRDDAPNAHTTSGRAVRSATQRIGATAAWLYIAVAALIVVAIPLGVITKNALAGLGAASIHSLLIREIGVSLLFAVAAASVSWSLAGAAVRWMRRRRSPVTIASLVAIALPGLAGSLILGLATLRLFQFPGLRTLYGTILPAIVALTILLLPIAVLAHLVLSARQPTQALHAASLIAHPKADRQPRRVARAIRWQLHHRPRVWAIMLLLYLGFFDLSATAILHPPDMTPVTHRMYNLMHYGQLPTLFAAVLVTVMTPLAIAAVIAITMRMLRPRALS